MSIAVSNCASLEWWTPYVYESSVQFLDIVLLEGAKYLVENLRTERHDTSSAVHDCWFLVSHVDDRFLELQLIDMEGDVLGTTRYI